jgi:hypothetical protein
MLLTLLATLALGQAIPAGARSLIVPDDVPTIQAALDSIYPGLAPFDTVLVHAGSYPERLHCRSQVTVMGLADVSGQSPIVDALFLADEAGGWSDILFANIRFRGDVTVSYPAGTMVFRACRMDSGVVFILDSPSVAAIERCMVTGPVSVGGGGVLTVDSCDVHGQIVSANGGGELSVMHSTLQGPGNAGITGHADHIQVIGNIVRGFNRGIWIGADPELHVNDNVIEDCQLEGILTGDESVGIVGNRIARCGTGIDARGTDALVSRNEVLDCRGHGIVGWFDWQLEIDHNVVGRCGGDGIRLRAGNYGPQRIENNTVFSNTGSGLVVNAGTDIDLAVTKNIACANGGFGLLSAGTVKPKVWCNDWYANAEGAVDGMDSVGTGYWVPPRFCDLAAGDVHLQSSSLLARVPRYGLIGALGVACDTPERTVTQEGEGSPVLDPPSRAQASATYAFRLIGAAPSPGSGLVGIDFELEREAQVTLEVFDIQGRQVASLVRGRASAGTHRVQWTGLDDRGAIVPPGVYALRYLYPGGQKVARVIRSR